MSSAVHRGDPNDEEPWDEKMGSKAQPKSWMDEADLIMQRCYDDEQLDDGDLPALSIRKPSSKDENRVLKGPRTITTRPLKTPSRAGLETPVKEARQVQQSERGEERQEEEEGPHDEAAHRRASRLREMDNAPKQDDEVSDSEDEETDYGHQGYGMGPQQPHIQSSRDSLDDADLNFCDYTLASLGNICGFSSGPATLGSPARRATIAGPEMKLTTSSLDSLDVGGVEEYTAIEVEYVDPRSSPGPDEASKSDSGSWPSGKKNAYLAAMAKKAKEDFEKSSVGTGRNKRSKSLAPPASSPMFETEEESEDVYNSFNATEKRKFLKLINSGMTPTESTKAVIAERKNKDNKTPKSGKGRFSFWKRGNSPKDTPRSKSLPKRSFRNPKKQVENYTTEEKKQEEEATKLEGFLTRGTETTAAAAASGGKTLGVASASSKTPLGGTESPARASDSDSMMGSGAKGIVAMSSSSLNDDISRSVSRSSGDDAAATDGSVGDLDREERGGLESFAKSGINYYDAVRKERRDTDEESAEPVTPSRKGRSKNRLSLQRHTPKAQGFAALGGKETEIREKSRERKSRSRSRSTGASDRRQNDAAELESERGKITPPAGKSLSPSRSSGASEGRTRDAAEQKAGGGKKSHVITPNDGWDESTTPDVEAAEFDSLTRRMSTSKRTGDETAGQGHIPSRQQNQVSDVQRDSSPVIQPRDSSQVIQSVVEAMDSSQNGSHPNPMEGTNDDDAILERITNDLLLPVPLGGGQRAELPTVEAARNGVPREEAVEIEKSHSGRQAVPRKYNDAGDNRSDFPETEPVDLKDFDISIENYLESTEMFSQMAAAAGHDGASVLSGKSGKTFRTAASGVSATTTSSRIRRPGAAKNRLAKARQAGSKSRPLGWHESIRAAAANTKRVWDPQAGWVDYVDPTADMQEMPQPKPGERIRISLDGVSVRSTPPKNRPTTPRTPPRKVPLAFPKQWEHDRDSMIQDSFESSGSEARRVTQGRNTVPQSSGPYLTPPKPRGWVETMQAATSSLEKEGRRWDPEHGWVGLENIPAEHSPDKQTNEATHDTVSFQSQEEERQVIAEHNARGLEMGTGNTKDRNEERNGPEVLGSVSTVPPKTSDKRKDSSALNQWIEKSERPSIHRAEQSMESSEKAVASASAMPEKYMQLGDNGSVRSMAQEVPFGATVDARRSNQSTEGKTEKIDSDEAAYAEEDEEDDDTAPLLSTSGAFPRASDVQAPTIEVIREKVGQEDIDLFSKESRGPQDRRIAQTPNASSLRGHGSSERIEKVSSASTNGSLRRSEGPIDVDDVGSDQSDTDPEAVAFESDSFFLDPQATSFDSVSFGNQESREFLPLSTASTRDDAKDPGPSDLQVRQTHAESSPVVTSLGRKGSLGLQTDASKVPKLSRNLKDTSPLRSRKHVSTRSGVIDGRPKEGGESLMTPTAAVAKPAAVVTPDETSSEENAEEQLFRQMGGSNVEVARTRIPQLPHPAKDTTPGLGRQVNNSGTSSTPEIAAKEPVFDVSGSRARLVESAALSAISPRTREQAVRGNQTDEGTKSPPLTGSFGRSTAGKPHNEAIGTRDGNWSSPGFGIVSTSDERVGADIGFHHAAFMLEENELSLRLGAEKKSDLIVDENDVQTEISAPRSAASSVRLRARQWESRVGKTDSFSDMENEVTVDEGKSSTTGNENDGKPQRITRDVDWPDSTDEVNSSVGAEWKSFLGKKVRAENAAAARHQKSRPDDGARQMKEVTERPDAETEERKKEEQGRSALFVSAGSGGSLFKLGGYEDTGSSVFDFPESEAMAPREPKQSQNGLHQREPPSDIRAQTSLFDTKSGQMSTPSNASDTYSQGTGANTKSMREVLNESLQTEEGATTDGNTDANSSKDDSPRRNSFLKRLTACAAPILPRGNGSDVEELPLSHLRGSRFIPPNLCGRDNVAEGDVMKGKGVKPDELSRSSTVSSHSTPEPRAGPRSGQISSTSVVSDEFGAKTAYLDAIAMRTAVSKPKRSDSRGRRSSASDVSQNTRSSQSEKWREFLDRKAASGTKGRSGSSVSGVSNEAEQQAAQKVEKMMAMMASRGKPGQGNPPDSRTPQPSKAENNASMHAAKWKSDSARAAEDLAAARVEAMMAALSSTTLDEGEI